MIKSIFDNNDNSLNLTLHQPLITIQLTVGTPSIQSL